MVIFAVFEPTLGIFGTDAIQSLSHEFPQLRNLVGSQLPYSVFDFGPGRLDRVEVRTILGKKKNLRSVTGQTATTSGGARTRTIVSWWEQGNATAVNGQRFFVAIARAA